MHLALTEQAVGGPFTFCFFCTGSITASRAYILRDCDHSQTIGCVCTICARVTPEHLKAVVAAKIHQARAQADLLFARAAPSNTHAHAPIDLFMAQAEQVNNYADYLEWLLSSLDTPLITRPR